MTFVLDASAVLAVLYDERGADFVVERMRGADISVVNVGEVLTRAVEGGADADRTLQILLSYQLRIRPFTETHAVQAARLRPITKALGLGFGDRACLAQGLLSERPVLTADLDWGRLDPIPGLDIRLIR
jgi:PIN domain nuclease of toxin-antitoxin system